MKSLAKVLRKHRKIYGLTQEEASKIIGINRPRYATYEEGRAEPGLSDLLLMVKNLGYDSVESFYGIKQQKSKILKAYYSSNAERRKIVNYILGIK